MQPRKVVHLSCWANGCPAMPNPAPAKCTWLESQVLTPTSHQHFQSSNSRRLCNHEFCGTLPVSALAGEDMANWRIFSAVQDARTPPHALDLNAIAVAASGLGTLAAHGLNQAFHLALHHAEQAVRGLRAIIFHGLVGHQHCSSRVVKLGIVLVLGLGSAVRNEHRCTLTSSLLCTLSFACFWTVSTRCSTPRRGVQHRRSVAWNGWAFLRALNVLARPRAPSISGVGAPCVAAKRSTGKNGTLCNHGFWHLRSGLVAVCCFAATLNQYAWQCKSGSLTHE